MGSSSSHPILECLQVFIVRAFCVAIMGLVHSVVQTILSDTLITLHNTTVWPCAGLAAEINNDMDIHVPPGIPTLGLVDVQLNSFNMSLVASTCEGNACKDYPLGYFPTPVTHLQLGNNKAVWDIGATLTDASILLNDFILPLFFYSKTVDLTLSSDDVSLALSVAHLRLPSFKRLKLEKTLTCKMLAMTDPKDIPESFCHSGNVAGGRRLYSSSGYSIRCTPALWSKHKGKNCYDGHGATQIDKRPIGKLTLADCETSCDESAGCTGINIGWSLNGEPTDCWRLSNITMGSCDSADGYDTWTKTTPPPLPGSSTAVAKSEIVV